MGARMTGWRIAALAASTCLLSACEFRNTDPNADPDAPIIYSTDAPDGPVPMPVPASHEKCYGIAPAQGNDGGHKGPGTARLDKQTDAWKFVPRDKCRDFGGSLASRGDPRL